MGLVLACWGGVGAGTQCGMKSLLILSLLGACCVANAALDSKQLPAELAEPSVPAVENHVREGLPNFFSKLQKGGAVKIAYLGGSITAQEGWRPKTLKWFQQQFPKAQVSQINAAIGGTGSDLGVFRLQQDVLRHQPDLVFVEFAVNDGGAAPGQIYCAMEGIVRQIWKQDPATDICFVYTLNGNMPETLQAGKYPRSASAMEKVADHYGIPSIHMGMEVARLLKEGKVIFKGPKPKTDADKAALGDKILFSPDGTHPYEDTGHKFYLEAVARGMTALRGVGKAGAPRKTEAFVKDNWEAAKIVPLSCAKMSAGWEKLDPAKDKLAKQFQSRLPELYKGKPGETLTFKFNGVQAGFFDLQGPDCGKLEIAVDGEKPRGALRFDSYCTYHRLSKAGGAAGLAPGVHTIVCRVSDERPDKAKILSQRHEKIDKPERFEGLNWYVGSILLIGEPVKE